MGTAAAEDKHMLQTDFKRSLDTATHHLANTEIKRVYADLIQSLQMDHNSSPAREQGWMENESDELTETGFRKWVITNFSELKEHVLTQCKESKNLEKRFDKMLTRINSLEKNINELKELKNTTRELLKAYTNFNS
ncbi:LINE-1 retrotransposable element ORF1 protein [Plecturocebus cupreus]